jgi:O-antigen/teichoic acid export membrane protein
VLNRRRSLIFGLADASGGAGATFLLSITAARVLSVESFGRFALAFTALVMVSSLTAEFVYTPLELDIIRKYKQNDRLRQFFSATRRGGLPSSFLAVLAGMFALAGGVPQADSGPTLWLAISLATFLSVAQDHMRRFAHLAGSSYIAAIISSIQIVSIGTVLLYVNLEPPFVMTKLFLCLSLANLVSCIAAIAIIAAHRPGRSDWVPPGYKAWLGVGAPLALAGAIPVSAAYVSSALLSMVAGPAALGIAEGARLVARPVSLLGTGLASVVSPAVVELVSSGKTSRFNRLAQISTTIVASAGIGWGLLIWIPPVGGFLEIFVPVAYQRGYPLIAAAIGVAILTALPIPYRMGLIGQERYRSIHITEFVSGLAQVGLTLALASLWGPWALIAALLVVGTLRFVRYSYLARR